jgi:hypothetical protein
MMAATMATIVTKVMMMLPMMMMMSQVLYMEAFPLVRTYNQMSSAIIQSGRSDSFPLYNAGLNGTNQVRSQQVMIGMMMIIIIIIIIITIILIIISPRLPLQVAQRGLAIVHS